MRLPKLSRWTKSIVAIVVLFLALIAILHWNFSLPSDESLRSHFARHRSDCDELLRMIQQDQAVHAIWSDEMEMAGPKPDSSFIAYPPAELGFPADRFAKYQALLKAVGAKALFRMENDSIRLATGGWGFASTGPRWGYEWMPVPPNKDQTVTNMKELLQSLHNNSLTNEDSGERYIPLEKHWYFWFLVEG